MNLTMNKILYLLFLLVSAVYCMDDCGESITCVENKIRDFVEDIDKEGSVSLLGDFVKVEKTSDEPSTSRHNQGMEEKIINFFNTHSIKLKIPNDEKSIMNFLEETRSSKLKKIILPLILLLKLKAAIIVPAVLSAITLIALKGLGASLVALTLSGATAFKSLLDGHVSPKVTYEVVPQISHWSRSGMSGIEAYPIPGYHTIPQ